jgi:hypothetical protein
MRQLGHQALWVSLGIGGDRAHSIFAGSREDRIHARGTDQHYWLSAYGSFWTVIYCQQLELQSGNVASKPRDRPREKSFAKP